MLDGVDVVLLTLNSDRKLQDCLASIYQNVPVQKLIVVDGGSTDKTLQILDNFQTKYGNVEVIVDKGTRATARQKGIHNVSTEWFVFVDSDVVLCKDWYKKALKFVTPETGAVWGIEVWSTVQNQKVLKYFLWITRRIFELRGGTHDTLIRTQTVKDIQIPQNLHVFEDAYIKDWITQKGYQVIACYCPFCIHYRPEEVWSLQGSLGLISDSFRYGNIKLVAQLTAAYGFYTVYSVYQMLTQKNSS
jgi:glycosyltransferase involved in cell wall biosynthesis